MSKDPQAGKYQKWFQHEWLMADLILKPLGGTLTWSGKDYEAFLFTSEGVRILFYPHKTTSTGNIQCRIRDHGSKNKLEARRLMALLYIASGHSVTFYCKGLHAVEATKLAGKHEWERAGWANTAARELQRQANKQPAAT